MTPPRELPEGGATPFRSRLSQSGANIIMAAPVLPEEPNNPREGMKEAASCDWVELWDEEVQSYYYYNENSGEASWIKPDGLIGTGGTGPKMDNSTGKKWESYWDDDEGMWYSFCAETGETQWASGDSS